MSRFIYQAKKGNGTNRRLFFSLLFFLGLFLFFVYATGALASGNTQRQKESLVNAINKDVIYHYAANGSYPASLEEIEELYGLTYDKDTFYVDYDVRGMNIMPVVTVIERPKVR